MKKMLILFVLIACLTTSFAQEVIQSPTLSKEEYLKKSKSQKTWAWVLTGAGAVGLSAVFVADLAQSVDGGLTTVFSLGYVEPEYKSYTVPYIISAAVLASGITLFVASSKNRKKANLATAFLQMETAPTIHQAMVVKQSFPVLGIKIRL
jgi:hypothetical protein